jgi:hypothetical protein
VQPRGPIMGLRGSSSARLGGIAPTRSAGSLSGSLLAGGWPSTCFASAGVSGVEVRLASMRVGFSSGVEGVGRSPRPQGAHKQISPVWLVIRDPSFARNPAPPLGRWRLLRRWSGLAESGAASARRKVDRDSGALWANRVHAHPMPIRGPRT